MDGNVHIGADQGATVDNFAAALDLSGVSGTDYAATMTENEDVTGLNSSDNLALTAIAAGVGGNTLATTETSANASWGDPTLLGGLDGLYKFYDFGSGGQAVILKSVSHSIALEIETQDAIKIKCQIGWDKADIPDDVKKAVLLLITDAYEFRGEKELKLNRSSRNLLRPHKQF